MPAETHTQDTFFKGQIRVNQETNGYRFAIDAVLLAHHIFPRAGETVLDLGTGCGIVALILAFRHPGLKIYGVEIQKRLTRLAIDNVKGNRMTERIIILEKDMRKLEPHNLPAPIDWVVSNPPYRRSASGRHNPDPQKAVAMHEIEITLSQVVHTAHRMLRTGGRLVTIYPAERTTDILAQFRSQGIEPKQMRMIHSFADGVAKLVIVEGRKEGRPGMEIVPPLAIYESHGTYSEEVARMMAP